MKAIAFANRLVRDLNETNITALTADARLELVDAINGGLQKLHSLAPQVSKETTGGITVAAPETVSIGVTNGSSEITGHDFGPDEFYRTIRISGDDIDNQIVGINQLLHSYGGPTGTVGATFYGDAAAVAEPYDEMVGDPIILETRTMLTNSGRNWPCRKQVRRPEFYHVEANARNQNSPAPSVIRFDSLPDRLYRMEAKFTLAPARVTFSDLLAPGADIPIRAELVEVYLLPIARSILANSALWKNPATKASARADGTNAEITYEALTPKTLATPNNKVRTKRGW